MKKTIKYFLIAAIVIGSLISWWYYRDSTFVARNFELYTGIKKEYIEECMYYDNSQSFYRAIVPDNSIEKLLKSKEFVQGPFDNRGRISCPFINKNGHDYVYSVEKNGMSYGYILIIIDTSKGVNSVILYEHFGGF